MQLFFAENRNPYYLKRMREVGIGRIWADRHPKPYAGELWAFDNGAWSAFVHGTVLDEDRFLHRLEKAYSVGTPYMAVCPDIVMGGKESLEFSMKWIDKLPADWPWYLAVQDGLRFEDADMAKFAGIFIGGSDVFKSNIAEWIGRGYPVHYGRCGTRKKLRHAMQNNVTSADSSTPLQGGVNRFELFLSCYQKGDPQQWLFDEKEAV